MNQGIRKSKIKNIRIQDIHILNPRFRNKKVFEEITENITKVGLKRPITVTQYTWANDKPYVLVCGQGRLEAYMACGQSKIPAMIIKVEEEEALTMGLVENLARRKHTSLDLLKGIRVLMEKRYTPKQIAQKTGLTVEYVKPIVKLLKMGEERLLAAVESSQLPLDIAVKISASPGEEQLALQEAYENGQLRGKKFYIARKIIEARRNRGKTLVDNSGRQNTAKKTMSGRDVLKLYKKEADRRRLLIKKAEFVNGQLHFIVEALRTLFREEEFVNLLEIEALMTLPKSISDIIERKALGND
ncbi:plasmid partitioning protein RepB C-terminal domain-containing protein [uncultured Microbulbifer sp.]|uniref:plasmid partitioning protein RepB C-terminal domain-containing protein n=1 Tax=uncultured Microbulbifer sp. TaxID=348147 RepID=UPI002613967F|nr:plasmid partitioning protein RepB C-terminal domain-containing protein [uncultured Microbulbifer sp.]